MRNEKFEHVHNAYENLNHLHNSYENLDIIKKELENISDFQILADIFKQLGDPSRLRIFWLLCHYEECVINISSLLHMSSPAVSHHLRMLKNSNLITSRREGKEVIYRASDFEQSKLLHLLIEKSMEISCPKEIKDVKSQNDQVELVKEVHDYLLKNIDKKITIENLAQIFAINTTTLKEVFKSVYGTSIASHIKEHRMQIAAKLLVETNEPIAAIAAKVGFESQSKFSASFKEYYDVIPSKYRELKVSSIW